MRKTSTVTEYLKLVFFIFIATCLSIIRIPEFLVLGWPNWMLLVLLFFAFVNPKEFSIFIALLLGVTTDLLLGTHLGLHGLSYSLIGYFLLKFYQRISFFPFIQQILLVYLLLLSDNLVVALVHKSFGFYLWYSVLSALTTTIIWAVLFKLLGGKNRLATFR